MPLHSRRSLMSYGLAALAAAAGPSFVLAEEMGASPVADAWMRKWMDNHMGASGALHFTRFKDPIYVLTKPITWNPEPKSRVRKPITVPRGFVTDLASIPPQFFSLLRADGNYTYAAVVHDWCYWDQSMKREDADAVLNEALINFDIPTADRLAITGAVWGWGEGAWNTNAAHKKKGEQRILARYPEDPRITWAQWKVTPGVFKK